MKGLKLFLPFVLGCGLVMMGCVSFSTYQTPEVLEAEEVSAGIGLSGITGKGADGGQFGYLEAYGRYGLGHNFDVGLNLMGVPPIFLIKGDLKYQFLRNPLNMSGSFGASYTSFENNSTTAFYPLLLAGGKYLHVGVKWIMFTSKFDLGDEEDSSGLEISTEEPLLGFVIGGQFGQQFQLLPEVNIYTGSENNETLIFYGVGLRYKF